MDVSNKLNFYYLYKKIISNINDKNIIYFKNFIFKFVINKKYFI